MHEIVIGPRTRRGVTYAACRCGVFWRGKDAAWVERESREHVAPAWPIEGPESFEASNVGRAIVDMASLADSDDAGQPVGLDHEHNYDRVLFGGGMSCTICDDVEDPPT